MNMSLLAIDLAKNTFQLHGVDERGQPVLRKQVTRKNLPQVVHNLPPCRIVMEACASANYWARRFQAMGHSVQLIAAQFVKPFVKSHKNDRADAEAIAEAASRPTMRYVPVKTIEQQDVHSSRRQGEGMDHGRIGFESRAASSGERSYGRTNHPQKNRSP